MTDRAVDVGELAQEYRDLTPLDGRPEGDRYQGSLTDGRSVVVTLVARALGERLQQPDEFIAGLQSVRSGVSPVFPSILRSGRTATGLLHFAVERRDVEAVSPGVMKAPDLAVAGAELARALAAAHAAGLVHGAVSTPRIGVGPAGTQLEGLGLFAALYGAGLKSADAASSLSEAPYVAPEVRLGDSPDARSDIYSLGASLFELLTGKPPVGGRTTSFVMATVLSDEPTSDESQTEAAPSGPIVDAILRAIEATPSDRWPDATAFAAALDAGAGASAEILAARKTGCLPRAAAVSLLLAAVAAIAVR